MAAVSSILAGVAVAGTAIAIKGKKDESRARSDMTDASVRAENLREQQMNLEAQRAQRDIARKAQVARSIAISRGANQGALYGSAVPGAEGQIASQAGQESNAVEQNKDIGTDIFAANRDYARASGRATTQASIAGFGTSLIGLSQPIAQIGSTIFSGFGSSGDQKAGSSYSGK